MNSPKKAYLYLILSALITCAALCSFVFYQIRGRIMLAHDAYTRDSEHAIAQQRRNLEEVFSNIYSGLRTIARLPGIRIINDKQKKILPDTNRTIQEIYNDLFLHVSLSEVYIVPLNLDPDSTSPNFAKEPLVSFDHLIVGKTADTESEDKEEEEVEIFEYRALRDQIKWFKAHTPYEISINQLNYPALISPEVLTCDNSEFSEKNPDDAMRNGIIYSVPFYDFDGNLRGMVSAIIRTASIARLIQESFYTLTNKATAYVVNKKIIGKHAAVETETQAAPLAQSQRVAVLDLNGDWVIESYKPEFFFWNSNYVRDLFSSAFYYYIAAVILSLTYLTIALLWLRMQRLQKDILNKAADAIITLSSTLSIKTMNVRAEKQFGYLIAEMKGKNLQSLLDEVSYRNFISFMEEHTRNGSENTSPYCELTGIRKDGSSFPLELALSTLTFNTSNVYILIIRDTTARHSLELQLRQAQKLESIGQLAAGIAHEINTPIQFVGDNVRFVKQEFNGIKELMELCASSGELPGDSSAQVATKAEQIDSEYLSNEIPLALEQSLEGIARITKIVSAMKEFSHPGQSEKQAVDLNRAIESTIIVSTNEWKYVSEMKTDFDPTLPLVPCIIGELNQVILNLIVNSAHSIEEIKDQLPQNKGLITVKTRNRGDCVEIKICDTGNGIPATIAEKIFNPFFTTKEVGKGTGQGLAIARNIITNKHGGTIDFESIEGQGTEFTITLPLKETVQQPSTPSSSNLVHEAAL